MTSILQRVRDISGSAGLLHTHHLPAPVSLPNLPPGGPERSPHKRCPFRVFRIQPAFRMQAPTCAVWRGAASERFFRRTPAHRLAKATRSCYFCRWWKHRRAVDEIRNARASNRKQSSGKRAQQTLPNANCECMWWKYLRESHTHACIRHKAVLKSQRFVNINYVMNSLTKVSFLWINATEWMSAMSTLQNRCDLLIIFAVEIDQEWNFAEKSQELLFTN